MAFSKNPKYLFTPPRLCEVCGADIYRKKADSDKQWEVRRFCSSECYAEFKKTVTTYRVEDRGYETPCWIWQGKVNSGGYGRAGVEYAHRWSYVATHGAITKGLQIDHLCRVKLCINPDHLEAVSPRINVLRSEAPSAIAWREKRGLERHQVV